jgi:hypothetical protein
MTFPYQVWKGGKEADNGTYFSTPTKTPRGKSGPRARWLASTPAHHGPSHTDHISSHPWIDQARKRASARRIATSSSLLVPSLPRTYLPRPSRLVHSCWRRRLRRPRMYCIVQVHVPWGSFRGRGPQGREEAGDESTRALSQGRK